MVHLFTLANLLVQFRHKKQRLFLFSIYLNNEPRTFSNAQVPPNNLTMFLRYDKMRVALLTSARDDDRCVTVLKLDETTTRSYVFILETAQDDISCNSTRRRSLLSQEITSFQTLSAKGKCSVKCDANNCIKNAEQARTCLWGPTKPSEKRFIWSIPWQVECWKLA